MIIAALVLAAVSVTTPQPQVMSGLLEVAKQTCPTRPGPDLIVSAAKSAHLTYRDTQTMLALCSIYAKGRSDQLRQDSIRFLGYDPAAH